MLRHVLPDRATSDFANERSINTETRADYTQCPRCLPNGDYIRWREFRSDTANRPWCLLRMPILTDAIQSVSLVVSKEQMSGVATSGMVARMANESVSGVNPIVQEVCDPMVKDGDAGIVEDPVWVLSTLGPEPTCIGRFDGETYPESFKVTAIQFGKSVLWSHEPIIAQIRENQ